MRATPRDVGIRLGDGQDRSGGVDQRDPETVGRDVGGERHLLSHREAQHPRGAAHTAVGAAVGVGLVDEPGLLHVVDDAAERATGEPRHLRQCGPTRLPTLTQMFQDARADVLLERRDGGLIGRHLSTLLGRTN